MGHSSTGLCECGCGGKPKVAEKTQTRWGDVAGQPRRFVNGHQNAGRIYTRRSIYERLAEKVERRGPDECWPWTGARGGRDRQYGVIGAGGKHGTNLYVHRVAYEEVYGPIPAGLSIDHVRKRGCTSRLCCNPAHLEAVTGAVNVRRGRQTKLSDRDVRAIRRAALAGVPQCVIARGYQVHQSTISGVVNGKSHRADKSAIVTATRARRKVAA